MKNKRSGKRTGLILVLVLIVFAASITAVAEFTKSSRAKRVISASPSEGMLFSSNYLKEAGATPNYATVYITRAAAEDLNQTSFSTIVSLYNHAQGNPTRYYRRAINYTLTTSVVRIVPDGEGNPQIETVLSGLPAVQIDGAPMQANYSGSIAAGGANETSYTLTLPRSMLTGEKLYVQMTATPTGATYADLAPITALFDLAIKPEATATSWHLESTDDRANGVGEYAGYNFRLSGSGKGTILLGWDADKLELSEVFQDAVGAAAPSGGIPAEWSGLTAVEFEVDAANINSYDIQFYLTAADAVASWNDVAAQMVFTEE